ncbi:nitroreductase family deazaflavin-dependent oxidoreductase [Nocardia spumae]|uniref:nitroreductase family deazaflavin-dependent oxidoreductase n=2 Tax=Nocardia spumae TaxID=2887190 RepID=UPI0030D92899
MSTEAMPIVAGMVSAASQFANRHGIYAGRRSTAVHVRLYRWSGGRIGGHLPGRPAARILLLEHTGARSGIVRTSPLMYVDAGEAVAIAASRAGQPRHPGWYHNLLADPDTTIRIGGELRPVRARVATADEYGPLWRDFVAATPDFEFYRSHAAGRDIPIVVLDRR